MKTIAEIKAALEVTAQTEFTISQVAHIIDAPHSTIRLAFRNANRSKWTKEDILRYVEGVIGNSDMLTSSEAAKYLGISYPTLNYYIKRGLIVPDIHGRGQFPNRFSRETLDGFKEYLNGKSAKSESETSAVVVPITANPEPATEYVSPIDVLIHIDKTINEDPNVKAYYDMKNRFEQMNEAALQKLFSPMLERFKFAYICKCVPEIQSQMLTCINKGKLRGMEKYGMDFNAFLKLVKFAHDNYVPLDAIDNQGEGVNA